MGALCRAITEAYGVPSQEAMAVGEIGELLTLFGRRAQKRDSEQAWVDEIADGLIMLRQLAEIHGAAEVEARIAQKVEVLWTRPAVGRFRPVSMSSVLGAPYQPDKESP
jgi:hypothetical protein